MKIKIASVALIALLGACGGTEPSKSANATAPNERPSPSIGQETSIASTDVIEALQEAGLEAEHVRPMVVEDFGMAPKLTDDATRFLIPSLGGVAGGRAFGFESLEDLRLTEEFYDEMGKSSAILFSWTYSNEERLVLVQINGTLAEAKAEHYQTVVENL